MSNYSALQDSSASTGKHKFLPACKHKVFPVNVMKAYGEVKISMHILLNFCTR